MPKPNKISSPFGSYAPDYAEVRVLENVSNFDLELDFTDTYQKNINEHVSNREARCLEILLPRIFQEIKKGDIFAGRTEYRQIGFGLENASGGPGFYCYEHNLRSEIENSDVDAATWERLEAAIELWSREATIAGKLVGSLPEDVRKFTTNQIASKGGRLSGAMLDFNKLMHIGIWSACFPSCRCSWFRAVKPLLVPARSSSSMDAGGSWCGVLNLSEFSG